MEDNYKFSKASHYLDQDNVKQNQFMVPNKSFNSKASPTKLQLQSSTYKSFNTKASPIKASPTKASSMVDNYKFSKASHYLQDSVKQINSWYPTKALTPKLHYKSSTPKLYLQKLHLQKLHPQKLQHKSFNSKASPTKA
ncbi:hypothetical protein ACFX2H_031917 [Malus domestica]